MVRPGTGVDFEVAVGVSALTRTNFFVPIILKRLFDFLVLLVEPLKVTARFGHCFSIRFMTCLVIIEKLGHCPRQGQARGYGRFTHSLPLPLVGHHFQRATVTP